MADKNVCPTEQAENGKRETRIRDGFVYQDNSARETRDSTGATRAAGWVGHRSAAEQLADAGCGAQSAGDDQRAGQAVGVDGQQIRSDGRASDAASAVAGEDSPAACGAIGCPEPAFAAAGDGALGSAGADPRAMSEREGSIVVVRAGKAHGRCH